MRQYWTTKNSGYNDFLLGQRDSYSRPFGPTTSPRPAPWPKKAIIYWLSNSHRHILEQNFKTYLSSLCLYFIRTVPEVTSMMQIEFPPHVATFEVVLSGLWGSGSKTTSQIWKTTKVEVALTLSESYCGKFWHNQDQFRLGQLLITSWRC